MNDPLQQLRALSQVFEAAVALYLHDPLFYVQIALFLLLGTAALIVSRILRRLQRRLPGGHWQRVTAPFYFPLTGLLSGRLIVAALALQERELPLFERLYALFWVLLFYRAASLLIRRLAPKDAGMIQRRILLPLSILFVILRLAGTLSPLLRFVFNTPIVTLGEGESAVGISLSLVLFGPLAIALIYIVAQAVRGLLIEDVLPSAGLPAPRAYAVGTLMSYALIVTALLFTLASFGIDLTTLTVIGSALAVGIGLGMQDTINNFVSGFFIMFDPQIDVGDLVEVENERGYIRNVNIRNTTIETIDGTRAVLPNSMLANSTLLNLSRSSRPYKVVLDVPVTIEADAPHIVEVITEILRKHPDIRPAPEPLVTLKGFAYGAMTFQVTFWVETIVLASPVTSAVNLAIWEALRDLGYELAPRPPVPLPS